MREVIMHAQPSSGTMRLNFGPYVRPNAACISRLLHTVDNIITVNIQRQSRTCRLICSSICLFVC